MKLSDVITEDFIITDMKSSSLREAFEEVSRHITRNVPGIREEQIIEALWNREQEKTTVRSGGFAIPRARIPGFDDFIFAIGRSKEGIDCGAPDNSKTHLFFFLVASVKKNKFLIQTKKAVYELARDLDKREAILNAPDARSVIKVMADSEVHVTHTLTAFDIMNPQVVYVTPDMNISECANVFYQNNISGAPVINENGEVFGEITEKELIKAALPQYLDFMEDLSFVREFEPFEEFYRRETQIRVKDICKKEFTTVSVDSPIIEIAFLVTSRNVRRIFVVDDKKLIGIIMRRDLITQVIHS